MKRSGFTLLELLLATFLSSLLLVFLYQSFGQVARQFRLARETPDPMEVVLFQEQIDLLTELPSFRDGCLHLRLNTPLGPWEARYCLERNLYAEAPAGAEENQETVFPGCGLQSLALFALEGGKREELDPSSSWPKGQVLELSVTFSSGRKGRVFLR